MSKLEAKRPVGRPSKYLTIQEWNHFIGNHWWHLNFKVNLLVWAMGILWVTIITAAIAIVVEGK
jgi:hypothetical protein